MPYSRFHSGYKQMDRRPDELITKVRLKRTPSDAPGHTVHYYRKVGTRAAQAISKVCFAAFARVEGHRLLNVRLGLGSVAPIPLRCTRTESVLLSGPLDEPLIRRAGSSLTLDDCSLLSSAAAVDGIFGAAALSVRRIDWFDRSRHIGARSDR